MISRLFPQTESKEHLMKVKRGCEEIDASV